METVNKLFDTTDLYSVLGVDKSKAGDPKALRMAYMKAALRTHPDKGPVTEREQRTQKFQLISQIYELMKDPDLRKAYDETGEWPDKEEFVINFTSFGRLDEQTIQDFKKTYLGSEEEKEDVIKLYKDGKGDILYVLDNLFFANILEDEERVQGIVDELIQDGKLKELKGKVNKRKRDQRIKKAKKEAEEAEELRKEMGVDVSGMDGLHKALATKAKARSGFLDELEAKYSAMENGSKAKRRKK